MPNLSYSKNTTEERKNNLLQQNQGLHNSIGLNQLMNSSTKYEIDCGKMITILGISKGLIKKRKGELMILTVLIKKLKL